MGAVSRVVLILSGQLNQTMDHGSWHGGMAGWQWRFAIGSCLATVRLSQMNLAQICRRSFWNNYWMGYRIFESDLWTQAAIAGRNASRHRWQYLLVALLMGGVSLIVRGAGPGDLDPTFGRQGTVVGVDKLIVQADGRIITASDGPGNGGKASLHRYFADGTVDPAFDTGSLGLERYFEMADGGDGRVYIRGVFSGELVPSRIVRLLPTGLVDPGFVPEPRLEMDKIASMPDGRLLVHTGWPAESGKKQVPGDHVNEILRLKADGSIDDSFQAVTNALGIDAITYEGDNRIYLCGQLTQVNGIARFGVARLLENGTVDPKFNPVPLRMQGATFPMLSHTVLTPQKKLLVFGLFDSAKGIPLKSLAQLRWDGTLDEAFHPPVFDNSVNEGFPQRDGRVVVVGSFDQVGSARRRSIARLNADGSVDESFLVPLPKSGSVRTGARLPNDDVIICDATSRRFFGKAQASGAAAGPPAILEQPVSQIRLRAQSAVLAAAVRSRPPTLFQWKFNGRDIRGANSAALSFPYLEYSHMGTYQLTASNQFGTVVSAPAHLIVNSEPVSAGALDLTLDPGESTEMPIDRVAMQGEKILILGQFRQYQGTSSGGLARIHPDGRLDESFHSPPEMFRIFSALAVDSERRIYVAGEFCQYGNVDRCGLVRLLPDGEVDPSFVPAVPQGTRIFDLSLLNADRILVAGTAGDGLAFTGRLDGAGKRDSAFAWEVSGDGQVGLIHRLSAYPDGRFLAAGYDPGDVGARRQSIRRFFADGRQDSSFVAPVHASRFEGLLACGDGGAWASSEESGITIGDGKGPGGNLSVVRLLADGRVDRRFVGKVGPVTGLGQFPNGDIALANFPMSRWTQDGRRDSGFRSDILAAKCMAVDARGRMVIVGNFARVNDVPRKYLARIHTSEQMPEAVFWGPFQSGSGFELSLPTLTNRVYALETTSRLDAVEWSPLIRLLGNGNWQTVLDPATDSATKFYRLRIEMAARKE